MGNALRRRMISSNLERLICLSSGPAVRAQRQNVGRQRNARKYSRAQTSFHIIKAGYRQKEKSDAQESACDFSVRISRSRPVRISIADRSVAQQGDSVYRGGA